MEVDQDGSINNDHTQDYQLGDESSNVIDESFDDNRRGRGGGARGGGRAGGRGGVRSGVPRNKPFDASGAGDGVNPEDANTLFEHVRVGRAALQTIVDEWIDAYRADRESASLDLMQFFIRSSGCKGKITPVMRETMDNAQIIRQFVDEFDEDAGNDYPLVMTGPPWKKWRSNFCDFVNTLVRQCQYSIIYDQYLMESIISLLITLSDSQVRAFRHTATLAAMKLMTALVDVALTLSINLDNNQRQYESERMKSKDRRASEKLDTLMQKRQELDENMEDIRTMLGYLFKSIFVHRYRDSIAEIRAICMSEIGVWMKRFPNHFLDDSYLKYVGWTLHDKVGDVRLKCLQALIPLYESEEIARKMELFTNKFKDRIVQMALDKEFDVSVQAVKLICSIHKFHPEVLSDKDCESIYELVFCNHRQVAQAAGEFLNERLFQVDPNAPPARSRRGKKRSIHTPLIRDLIQFFIESELHDHGAYLVDSLIDSHPMMKDWECMTDLILEEPGPDEEVLPDAYETRLIEIMVCSIRQAATGEPPVGRGPVRKVVSSKEAKQIQDDKNRISEHFIQALPSLLDKFKSDDKKIANLVVIPQFFELSYFTQNQDSLDHLLKLLNEVIEINSDAEVLEGAAKTYEYLHDDNFTFSRSVWLSRSNLFDTLSAKYKTAVERYFGRHNAEAELLVVIAIKKLAIFYACHDLSQWNLWDDLFERWIKSLTSDDDFPLEAVKYAIHATHMGLLWDLHLLTESRNPNTTQNLKNRMQDYLHVLKNLLRSQQESIQDEVYFTICDLLIVFSHQLEDSGASPLIYRPDRNLIQALEDFVVSHVFLDDEEEEENPLDGEDHREAENRRIEILAKKRHFLSAYCKLIVYNVLPVRQAACVIKNFVRFFQDFGDIIKTTLGKTREINKILCAKTMATALVDLFEELKQEASANPVVAFTKQDDNFQALKELAKRFALSFGLDNQKNRDAIAALHREGIQYTFKTVENPDNPLGQPPNLPFLEVLSEFSNKLLRQDKKTVLNYLEKYVRSTLPGIHMDEWQPLMTYRSSLTQHNEFDIPLSREPGRHYSKGNKRTLEDGEDGDDRESEGGSEATDA